MIILAYAELITNPQKDYPILVWKGLKLLKNNNTKFNVYARGQHFSPDRIASVMVVDEFNFDALSENSLFKNELIDYFSNGLKNLENTDGFYRVFSANFDVLKTNLKNLKRGVGKSRSGSSFNPQLYIFGYLDYEINLVSEGNSGKLLNELKFNAVHSSFYTEDVMTNFFGKEDKKLIVRNEDSSIYIWKAVKLFKNDNKIFTVFTKGVENCYDISASVLVFDQDNNDCLAEGNPYREKIINYFSENIQKLKINKS